MSLKIILSHACKPQNRRFLFQNDELCEAEAGQRNENVAHMFDSEALAGSTSVDIQHLRRLRNQNVNEPLNCVLYNKGTVL